MCFSYGTFDTVILYSIGEARYGSPYFEESFWLFLWFGRGEPSAAYLFWFFVVGV
jgi:hypothetical protein